jgi:AAA+ superfamily predicted ATPase
MNIELPEEINEKIKEKLLPIVNSNTDMSIYDRDDIQETIFMQMPPKDQDPNGIAKVLRPLGGLIGLEKQIKTMDTFLEDVKTTPGSTVTNHFMIFYGPPGTGKTKLAKKIAEKHGFYFKEWEHGDSEDKWLGGQEPRVKNFFEKACFSTRPVFLFIDEIDSVFAKVNDSGTDSGRNAIQLTEAFQIKINNLEGIRSVNP